jgi:anti-sigma-K factor RskA
VTHDEVSELLGAFALDAVDGDEYEQIEAHLAECPRCRAEVDAHREVAAALGNSVEPLPEGLWDNIARRLPPRGDEEAPPMPLLVRDGSVEQSGGASKFRAARVSRPGGPARPSRSTRSRLAAVAFIAVAAAVVAIVLGVNLVHDNRQISQLRNAVGPNANTAVVGALKTPGHKLVNVETPGHKEVAQFVVVPTGQGYLVKSELPTLSSNKTYQLWGVFDGRSISLGLLGQSPHQATFTSAGSKTPTALAVTVEPAGGSVIPTGPMLGTGTV